MSKLVEHAEYELKKAGLFDNDADYMGVLAKDVMQIIELFAKQGHSGASAAYVAGILELLLRFKPLSPITNDPDEWGLISQDGEPKMWQNKRDGEQFSMDGGKTWNKVYRHG
jgi:hypothetical protein